MKRATARASDCPAKVSKICGQAIYAPPRRRFQRVVAQSHRNEGGTCGDSDTLNFLTGFDELQAASLKDNGRLYHLFSDQFGPRFDRQCRAPWNFFLPWKYPK
jgi:hypothetical protein